MFADRDRIICTTHPTIGDAPMICAGCAAHALSPAQLEAVSRKRVALDDEPDCTIRKFAGPPTLVIAWWRVVAHTARGARRGKVCQIVFHDGYKGPVTKAGT